MIALTIVATLKAVGIILSISLLIAPGAIALLLTRRFISALLLAVAIAVSSSLGGVWLSFYLDSAPAPTIVVLFTALFIITFVWTSVRDNQTQATSAETRVAADALPGRPNRQTARIVARLSVAQAGKPPLLLGRYFPEAPARDAGHQSGGESSESGDARAFAAPPSA